MNIFLAAYCQNTSSHQPLIGSDCLPHTTAGSGTITDALNAIFVIVGALAFLMIVIAGFRYILAGGEATKVAESKKMIIYAAIGLLVVAMAAAIVNFVLGKV